MSCIVGVFVITGRRRLIKCFTSQVIFRTKATNYSVLLRKMKHKDKASYGSWPPCIKLLVQNGINTWLYSRIYHSKHTRNILMALDQRRRWCIRLEDEHMIPHTRSYPQNASSSTGIIYMYTYIHTYQIRLALLLVK